MKKRYIIYIIILVVNYLFASCENSNIKWRPFSDGIFHYTSSRVDQNEILIAYAGWSVKPNWVKHWVENLERQMRDNFRLSHIFAVQGPKNVGYDSLEIGNQDLAEFLVRINEQQNIDRIIVIAHSSGSFVAHELFNILYNSKLDSNGVTQSKISYFNLDGAVGEDIQGLNQTTVNSLQKIYAVYAYDSTTSSFSANVESMQELAELYPSKVELLRIDASASGCIKDAQWCLHDALITKKPYNPQKFDLEKDYRSINPEHPVNSDYLKVLTEF